MDRLNRYTRPPRYSAAMCCVAFSTVAAVLLALVASWPGVWPPNTLWAYGLTIAVAGGVAAAARALRVRRSGGVALVAAHALVAVTTAVLTREIFSRVGTLAPLGVWIIVIVLAAETATAGYVTIARATPRLSKRPDAGSALGTRAP